METTSDSPRSAGGDVEDPEYDRGRDDVDEELEDEDDSDEEDDQSGGEEEGDEDREEEASDASPGRAQDSRPRLASDMSAAGATSASLRSDSPNSEGAEDEDELDQEVWYEAFDTRVRKPPVRKNTDIGVPEAATRHLADLSEVADPPSNPAAHQKAWRHAAEVSFRHFVHLVRKKCQEADLALEDPASVLCICELAQQVVANLKPMKGDLMDISRYVKVKKIAGGHFKDSWVVDGVVFTRDVTHKQMKCSIDNCNLTLLREPLSFDNVKFENDSRLTRHSRLTRLDDLRRQEEESMNIKVGKIARDLQPKPQLLLCQGSVSRLAQESLRSETISLVLGVKPHILDAVARCTGAKVLESVDMINMIVRPTLGGRNASVSTCKKFEVKRLGEAGSKSLVFIECNNAERFSTVCLKGGEGLPPEQALQLLRRAKNALLWAIKLGRHLQLEAELLFEMWCEPWPRPSLRLPAPGPPPPSERVAEFLDIICYRIRSEERMMCQQPFVYRLPAYGRGKPRSFDMGAKSDSWAGGLDAQPIEGFEDCTLRDWLTSCFRQAASHHGMDDSRLAFQDGLQSELLQPPLMHSFPGEGGGFSSFRNSFVADASTRYEMPPTPRRGEALCFQHLRSRIRIVLHDGEREPMSRQRISSSIGAPGLEARTARARWSLLDAGDQGPHQDDESAAASLPDGSVASRGGIRSVGTTVEGVDVEVKLWCQDCDASATPRNALSESSTWHSVTRFLEMMLHNNVSRCSPLAASALQGQKTCQCANPEAAFRSCWVLCSSPNPQVPLVVCIKWEPVQLWRLHPPHQPFWDPETGGFKRASKAEAQSLPPKTSPKQRAVSFSAEESSLPELKRLEELHAGAGDLIKCILMALGANNSHTAPAREWARERTGSIDDSMLSHWPIWYYNEAAPKFKTDEAVPQRLQNALLSAWVWDNRNVWSRALKDLNRLHTELGKAINTAKDRLCAELASTVEPLADPVLTCYVKRELLEVVHGPLGNFAATQRALDQLLEKHMPGEDLERKSLSIWNVIARGQEFFQRVLPAQVDAEVAAPLSPNAAETRQLPTPSPPARSLSGTPQNTSLQDPGESAAAAEAPPVRRSLSLSSGVAIFARPDDLQRSLTTADNSVAAQVKQAEELTNLRSKVEKVKQRIEDVVGDEKGRRLKELGRGVLGVCLPVHETSEDDVGSLIAHALLSTKAHYEMEKQWGPPFTHCPLAEKVGSREGCWSCWASLPAAMKGEHDAVSTPTLLRGGHVRVMSTVAASSSSGPATPGGSAPPAYSTTACEAGMIPNGSASHGGGASLMLPLGDERPSVAGPGGGLSPAGDVLQRLREHQWKRLPEEACSQDGQHGRSQWEDEWERKGVRQVLTGLVPKDPIEVEFEDNKAKYKVTIHHAPQYHILRHWLCGDDLNFARSLHHCKQIKPQGGKSKAAFFVSKDQRFLLKTINKAEFKKLVDETSARALFCYLDEVLFGKRPSVLAQVLGLFTVSPVSKTKKASRYFIVQRNLRFGLPSRIDRIFDLKGVGKSRKVQTTAAGTAGGNENADNSDPEDDDGSPRGVPRMEERHKKSANALVLWDQNFREWSDGKPLCLVSRDLKYLEAAVCNDTHFLAVQDLVDYSLLLAVVEGGEGDGAKASDDSAGGTLSLGIIDYLRPYTWDKKLESQVKQWTKNAHDKAGPTIVKPDDYAPRFRQAMGTFFVA